MLSFDNIHIGDVSSVRRRFNIPGEHHNGNMRLDAPHGFGDLCAIQTRPGIINYYQVNGPRGKQLQASFTIRASQHLIACFLQQEFSNGQSRNLIINAKNNLPRTSGKVRFRGRRSRCSLAEIIATVHALPGARKAESCY